MWRQPKEKWKERSCRLILKKVSLLQYLGRDRKPHRLRMHRIVERGSGIWTKTNQCHSPEKSIFQTNPEDSQISQQPLWNPSKSIPNPTLKETEDERAHIGFGHHILPATAHSIKAVSSQSCWLSVFHSQQNQGCVKSNGLLCGSLYRVKINYIFFRVLYLLFTSDKCNVRLVQELISYKELFLYHFPYKHPCF